MTTEKEILESFEQGVRFIRVFEQLSKNHNDNYSNHMARINSLQFLADRLTALRNFELAALSEGEVLQSVKDDVNAVSGDVANDDE